MSQPYPPHQHGGPPAQGQSYPPQQFGVPPEVPAQWAPPPPPGYGAPPPGYGGPPPGYGGAPSWEQGRPVQVPQQQGFHLPPPPVGPPPPRPRAGNPAATVLIIGGTLALVIIIVAAVVALLPRGSSGPVVPRLPVVAAPSVTTLPEYDFGGGPSVAETGSAGETLVANGISVTTTALEAGDSTLGATVCSTVTYVNDGSEQVAFGSLDWSMQTPSGVVVSQSFFGDPPNPLSAGELTPGATTSGDICFEDSGTGSGEYLVIYEPFAIFTADIRLTWSSTR